MPRLPATRGRAPAGESLARASDTSRDGPAVCRSPPVPAARVRWGRTRISRLDGPGSGETGPTPGGSRAPGSLGCLRRQPSARSEDCSIEDVEQWTTSATARPVHSADSAHLGRLLRPCGSNGLGASGGPGVIRSGRLALLPADLARDPANAP